MEEKANTEKQSQGLKLVNWLSDRAFNGVKPLCSAEDLAMEYRIDRSFPDDESRINALINWETTRNFTTGFITGLGGVITLPVSIPAALGASWIIQARMAAAIAILSGHSLESDRVKTFVMACLAGDVAKAGVKNVGVRVGSGFAKSAIERIPAKTLSEINRRVGFQLITKAGGKGAVDLMKMVPIAGGVVGGAFDAGLCRIVGKRAAKLFRREDVPDPEAEGSVILL